MMRRDGEDGVKTERNQTNTDSLYECVLMCVLCIRKAHTNTHRQTDRQTLNDS